MILSKRVIVKTHNKALFTFLNFNKFPPAPLFDLNPAISCIQLRTHIKLVTTLHTDTWNEMRLSLR